MVDNHDILVSFSDSVKREAASVLSEDAAKCSTMTWSSCEGVIGLMVGVSTGRAMLMGGSSW